ncbi:MAG: GHMP kinase, partial [Phycisphaeraceae bacterium]
MIISQTPYRVSFAGGGTDLPAFYEEEPGAVLSVGVRAHMYVTVHQRFEPDLRVAYSKTEIVDSLAELEHELVREAMRKTGTEPPLEITTIGDVPAGTGMGSSSTLTVGLLNALYAHQGRITGPGQLAREACEIEIDQLGKPIGRQDQYAAAYGGINYVRFLPGHEVQVEPVPAKRDTLDELESRALMFYTNLRRSADGILRKQSEGTADKRTVLREMRDLAGAMREVIAGAGDIDEF